MRNRMLLLGLLALMPVLLSLKGCETLSTPSAPPSHDRKPNVSAAVMGDCASLTFIPDNIDRDDEYRLWGQDRKALADCRALNAAKAATIASLQGN